MVYIKDKKGNDIFQIKIHPRINSDGW